AERRGGGDAAARGAVPGVGGRPARGLVLDLRERAAELAAGAAATSADAAPARAAATPDDERFESVVSALVNLGTARARAERAARDALEAEPDAPLEQLVRAALRRLAR